MRVVWTRASLRHVRQAYDYMAQFNPIAARRVADALYKAGDSLADFPHIGRRVPKTDMRELVTDYPYIIRYRIVFGEAVILRVRHTSRRPTKP